MNIDNITEIVVSQIPLIIGLVWKAAAEKAAIYRTIDFVKDSHDKQLSLLDKNLSLLTQESQSARLSLDEKLVGQGKRFGSKFERIERRVEDVLDYKVIISQLDKISKKLEE
jgi:hypothetical protein